MISFDFDVDAVRTATVLHQSIGSPANWTVMHGSILDRSFLTTLERADVVYSWGVLHHTGAMWQAVENAASLLKDDGVLYIALYCSDVYIGQTPEYWLQTKQRYGQAGAFRRRWMEWGYAWSSTIWPSLRNGSNPLKTIREYKASRGMEFWTDIKDWLGGWPMEFAGLAETKAFCKDRLELELVNISAGEANAEYLFRKRGASNYLDDVARSHPIELLPGPFEHAGGYAWRVYLPDHAGHSDSIAEPKRSTLMLFEDSVPVGFAHAPLVHILAHGGGRYLHSDESLLFSSTDNTDPNTNGRTYGIRTF